MGQAHADSGSRNPSSGVPDDTRMTRESADSTLSRIIYIINDPDAVSVNMRIDGKGEYVRHAIDRGMLVKRLASHIGMYNTHIGNSRIDEFSMVRHSRAHCWGIHFDDGQWPRDQLHDNAFAWPSHEPKYTTCTGWTPFQVILNDTFPGID